MRSKKKKGRKEMKLHSWDRKWTGTSMKFGLNCACNFGQEMNNISENQ